MIFQEIALAARQRFERADTGARLGRVEGRLAVRDVEIALPGAGTECEFEIEQRTAFRSAVSAAALGEVRANRVDILAREIARGDCVATAAAAGRSRQQDRTDKP